MLVERDLVGHEAAVLRTPYVKLGQWMYSELFIILTVSEQTMLLRLWQTLQQLSVAASVGFIEFPSGFENSLSLPCGVGPC